MAENHHSISGWQNTTTVGLVPDWLDDSNKYGLSLLPQIVHE
jgi:hypothetical protein